MKKIFRLIIAVLISVNFGCSNVFSGMGNKTTDEALLEDALKNVDNGAYDTAISNFSAMSTEYQTRRDIRQAWAGAYAGKCGFNFATFANSFTSASTMTTLFSYLMNAFKGIYVDPYSCVLAQKKIEEISVSPASRTTTENFFMFFLGLAKIGTFLRAAADKDGTSSYGDGSMDSSFDACVVSATNLPSTSPGQFSDLDIKHIVSGFGMILLNFSYVGATLAGSSGSTAITAINTACSDAALVAAGLQCDITDTDLVSSGMITVMRDIIHTSSANTTLSLGIGGCTLAPIGGVCCGQ